MRQTEIEILGGNGNTDELRKLFETGYTQTEIDVALENAIAYSQLATATYLLSLGADIASHDCNGAYYAAHNNQVDGLKFAIKNGVEINVCDGMLLNTAVITAINSKSTEMVSWLLNNGASPKLLTTQSLKLAADFGTAELKALIERERNNGRT